MASLARLARLVACLSAASCAGSPPVTDTAPVPPGSPRAPAPAASTAPSPAIANPPPAPSTATSVLAATAPVASTASGPCPTDMVSVGAACIDRFEAPNVQGAKPLLMRNVADAEGWCKERGKRLCSEDEWVRACKGPNGSPYPYGEKYQEHHCNQDGKYIPPSWGKLARWPADDAKAEAARLDQSEPAGQRATCVSSEGVFDLTGNAGEWVVRTREHPEACVKPEEKAHRYVVKGCFWGKCFRAPHEPSCDYVNCAHDASFRSYEFGARCCKDSAPGWPGH